MKPQQNRRTRNRNNTNNNRKISNPLTRTYESNGPDVKIRGTAQHIIEKYTVLARDAQAYGDHIMAENYLQHAEHYNRIILAAQNQATQAALREQEEEGDSETKATAHQQTDAANSSGRRFSKNRSKRAQPAEEETSLPTAETSETSPLQNHAENIEKDDAKAQAAEEAQKRPKRKRRVLNNKSKNKSSSLSEHEGETIALDNERVKEFIPSATNELEEISSVDFS